MTWLLEIVGRAWGWLCQKVLWVLAAWGLGAACDAGSDEGVLHVLLPEARHETEAELIGVGGRRLSDSDTYVVPLDGERRPVALGEVVREAFVIFNETDETVTVERLSLAVPNDAYGDEPVVGWRILAPTRSCDLPLTGGPWILERGARLDFDVRFAPTPASDPEVVMAVAIASRHGLTRRQVLLTGLVARGPP